jgi:hypothetical protein
LQPRCGSQLLCFHEAHGADYAFVDDGLADLGHQWWFSANWPPRTPEQGAVNDKMKSGLQK